MTDSERIEFMHFDDVRASTSQPSSGRSSLQLPPPYEPGNFGGPSSDGLGMSKVYPGWQSRDPRTSSTHSLVPSLNENEHRRTLLIVYIHGFMGNDSSFRSFPAHVHSYLKETLRETHVVHSKIYPRYKTYKAIDVARDNFSKWLEPHESPKTDIVLIGHSMGGLLAADIVLIPGTNGNQFRHRILGSISLDAPLLGLHPGIIVSGIASLFRPAPNPAKDNSTTEYLPLSPTASNSFSPDPSLYSQLAPPSGVASPSLPTSPSSVTATGGLDPYFNPPFFNDVQFKDRGWFQNIAHFTKKHMDENLVSAATNHIMSHLEFGGCLADYPGLLARYNKLRQLEDVDPFKGDVPPGAPRPTKVRFVNYFTISTGRITKPTSPSPHPEPEAAITNTTTHSSAPGSQSNSLETPVTNTTQGSAHGLQRKSLEADSKPSTPRISIEDHSDGGQPEMLQLIEPMPEEDVDEQSFHSAEETPLATSQSAPVTETTSTPDTPSLPADLQLPKIPDLPPQPSAPNLEQYASNPAARKLVEKEAKQAKKAYDQAVKNRDKAVAERAKLIKKHHAKMAKDAEKQKKADQKREKEEQKRVQKEEAAFKKEMDNAAKEQARKEKELQVKSGKEGQEAKKKERKFCMQPRKVNGVRDSAWVQVYMEGVDEVGAHCGLFFPGPHYERLVGDVGSRIVGWVQEDASRRAIIELEEGVEGLDVD